MLYDDKWKNKMKREKSALISGSVLYFRGRLNLVRIILGWDGLGIISYILVVFYNNEKSNRAGILHCNKKSNW
ncbi:NADH-ubiquinone oxidoreductase chain 5 [Armadillidium vulgare]|nr:NADH-ubiquinone oxidoreductase chain 5 [Armadillidium vulgare]